MVTIIADRIIALAGIAVSRLSGSSVEHLSNAVFDADQFRAAIDAICVRDNPA